MGGVIAMRVQLACNLPVIGNRPCTRPGYTDAFATHRGRVDNRLRTWRELTCVIVRVAERIERGTPPRGFLGERAYENRPSKIGVRAHAQVADVLRIGCFYSLTIELRIVNQQTQQLITLAVAVIGLLISLYLLYINIKNRGTQVSAYRINRALHRSSRIVLKYINTEQLDGRFLIKLVLFNPGSIASVIHSFAVFKPVKNPNCFFRMFKPTVLRRIEDAHWWPTRDENQNEARYLDDDYQHLYVEDYRVILVTIPGLVDRERYEFEIRTNNDYQVHKTYIDGIKGTHRFSHCYEEWFSEK